MPEILYGRNPVLEALRAGRRIRRLLVAQRLSSDARLDEIARLAKRHGVEEEEVSRPYLADVSHTEHHQGVAAYFDGRQLGGLEYLRKLLSEPSPPGWPPLVLCLDGVQDPQNLGSISRSAEAFGVTAMLLPRHRTAPPSPAAAKASAGAIEHLPLVSVVNLARSLAELAEGGLTVVGMDAEGSSRCDTVDLSGPLAVVVGAEGHGLRPLTRRHCDLMVSIPIGGRVGSLNASVAAALLLYEIARQRRFQLPTGSQGRG